MLNACNVSKVVMVTVPLPILLLVILLIRGLTLPIAMDGIRFYLTPDFSKLTDIRIWLRAYSQIFFSLSLYGGLALCLGIAIRKRNKQGRVTAGKNAKVVDQRRDT